MALQTKKRIKSTNIRQPTHPGTLLKEDILPSMGLSGARVATLLNVSRQYLSDVLNAKRGLSPFLCLKLAKLLGNSPAFWMNMQSAHTLWETMRDPVVQKELLMIERQTERPDPYVSAL